MRLKGFSLLEVAITLMIIGCIAGAGLPLLTNILRHQKQSTTDTHIKQVTQALAGYVLRNGELPYPAHPMVGEIIAGGSSVGIVPYKTLGLSESIAKDGWGNWITYAVQAGLAKDGDTRGGLPTEAENFCNLKVPHVNLYVVNQSRQSVIDQHDMQFIAFVLVSHGPSGDGAIQNDGSRKPTATSEKALNASGGPEYVDAPKSKDFDDQVFWVTRDNLMAIYANRPCQR